MNLKKLRRLHREEMLTVQKCVGESGLWGRDVLWLCHYAPTSAGARTSSATPSPTVVAFGYWRSTI